MKYMGSKRAMLAGPLGQIILAYSKDASRVVDLFTGSAAVAWFAAATTHRRVLAVDLQEYSVVLARAVIGRTSPLAARQLFDVWMDRVRRTLPKSKAYTEAAALSRVIPGTSVRRLVAIARELCKAHEGFGPIWPSYGGYYFSPLQAIMIDAMMVCLPTTEPERSACLASVITAAGKCVASPGHTAQPFRPTQGAGRYLKEAWLRDPCEHVFTALHDICRLHANVAGAVRREDALAIAATLKESDLVFVDPPYSNVQYSRFYHVLETVALGAVGEVSGAGRYPPRNERPQSEFSRVGKSRQALSALLEVLADVGASVILTIPRAECSNGLSGNYSL